MLKTLNRNDKTLRPFYTYKNWVIDTTLNEDLIINETGDDIYLYHYSSSIEGEVSGSLATQFQSYTFEQYPIEGLKLSGHFYELSDPYYETGSNPLNWNMKYKRVVFSTVDHMFYRHQDSQLQTFGIEKYDIGPNGEREIRTIHDRVNILNIIQNIYGEKIKPNSIDIYDYSAHDEVYHIKDDGYTNLILQDKYFSNIQQIQPPIRSPQMEKQYDIAHERFGKKICASNQYIIVGAPLDKNSLTYYKNGNAFLYRIDTSSMQNGINYKFIKQFETPFMQNGYSYEQVWDYTSQIKNNLGFYLLPEQTPINVIDEFGESVSLNDDFMAIGAPGSSYYGNNIDSSGQVFVYDKYKGGFDHWGLINILEGSGSNDRFGSAVCVSGSKLAVGAENAYDGKGAVYIYERLKIGSTLPTGSFWHIATANPEFWLAMVDELGDTLIVSEDTSPDYTEGNNVYILQHVVTSSEWTTGSYFGGSLKMDNNRIVVGSKYSSSHSSVYMFEYDNNAIGTGIYDTSSFLTPTGNLAFGTGSWTQSYVFSPSSITVGGTTQTHSINLNRTNYFFPTQVTVVPNNKDSFGYSLDFNSTHMVVGAPFDREFYEYSGSPISYKAGAAYVFNYTHSNWILTDKLYGREIDTVNNLFGIDVALYKNKIAVGSPIAPYDIYNFYDTSSKRFRVENLYSGARNASYYKFNTGEAFLYELNTSSIWEPLKTIKRIKYEFEPKGLYGYGIDIFENALVVGSPVNSYTNIPHDTTSWPKESGSLESSFIRKNAPYFLTGSVFLYDLNLLLENHQIGNSFYKNGIFTNTATASMFKDIFQGNVVNVNDQRGYSCSFQGTHMVNENEIFCSIDPGEFNVSTNPTSLKYFPIYYDIEKDGFFSLYDATLISKYILKQYNGLISGSIYPPEYRDTSSAKTSPENSWWKDDLVLLESEDVLLFENWIEPTVVTSSYTNYYDTIHTLDQDGLLDVNLDGKTDYKDAHLIMRYFLGYGGLKLTSGLTDDTCQRRYDDQIRAFLDLMTGKLNDKYIRDEFFNYAESSSCDKTGSYLASFVTTVGLYQDNELVMVGKLAKPIKNSGDYPITFNIKFDSF